MENLKILILDDEKLYREEIGEFLSDNKFLIRKASKPSEAFEVLKNNDIDIAILDIRLPEMSGLDVLQRIKDEYPNIEVIMISGHGDMDSVIQAMRLGATDYFSKPFRLLDVLSAIERTKRFVELNNRLKEIESNYQFVSGKLNEVYGHNLIGSSQAMKEVTEMIARVAKSDTTSVLITGESGTGKELVAKAIHYLSPRKDNYFYAVNSSAITETLFESEFFGHAKGSFTGASENKTGWFEVANKGTLFLDEIGDLPMGLQTKFLRVLEERKISRVGTHKEIDIDVRIVAATHQDLEKLTEERRFRLDLFHRLNSFVINIPPLRERKEDIPTLLSFFIEEYAKKMGKKIKGIDDSVFEALVLYKFPGNVRELRNMAERAIILCDGNRIKPVHFQLTKIAKYKNVDPDEEIYDLDVIERNAIVKAIKKANYNKSGAARLLKITFQSLDRRIKKFDLKFEKHLS
jgi:DNA-binding NtrC family response regulator